MRDDGTRWALVVFPTAEDTPLAVLSITEDAIPAAVSRSWIVLGRDSAIYAADEPIILSNPRRTLDDD